MLALNYFITALAATTTALPQSSKKAQNAIKSNHIDCRNGVDGFGGALYVAQAGFPFHQGVGCTPIFTTIQQHINATIENYECDDDGFGDTELRFESQEGWGEYLTEALKEAYPLAECCFDCRDGFGGGK